MTAAVVHAKKVILKTNYCTGISLQSLVLTPFKYLILS